MKSLIPILQMSPRVSKLQQVDESQSFENEENCTSIRKKMVMKIFLLSQYPKTILLKQSKNYLETNYQYQITYQFQ